MLPRGRTFASARHFPHTSQSRRHVNHGILWIPVIYGGIVYIGLLGLFGMWKFPCNNFPRFPEFESSGQKRPVVPVHPGSSRSVPAAIRVCRACRAEPRSHAEPQASSSGCDPRAPCAQQLAHGANRSIGVDRAGDFQLLGVVQQPPASRLSSFCMLAMFALWHVSHAWNTP